MGPQPHLKFGFTTHASHFILCKAATTLISATVLRVDSYIRTGVTSRESKVNIYAAWLAWRHLATRWIEYYECRTDRKLSFANLISCNCRKSSATCKRMVPQLRHWRANTQNILSAETQLTTQRADNSAPRLNDTKQDFQHQTYPDANNCPFGSFKTGCHCNVFPIIYLPFSYTLYADNVRAYRLINHQATHHYPSKNQDFVTDPGRLIQAPGCKRPSHRYTACCNNPPLKWRVEFRDRITEWCPVTKM
jgi:hypothetical protein